MNKSKLVVIIGLIFLSSNSHPVYSYHARGVKLTFMAESLFKLLSIHAFSLRRA